MASIAIRKGGLEPLYPAICYPGNVSKEEAMYIGLGGLILLIILLVVIF